MLFLDLGARLAALSRSTPQGDVVEAEGRRNSPGVFFVIVAQEGTERGSGNVSSWEACIPSRPHGCIDNLDTSFGASIGGTLTPGASLSNTKGKGGLYSHAPIYQTLLLDEIENSLTSSGRRYLACGARCTMGLSHFECEEPISFSG